MANAWFRLYSEFATDPKVQMMSEANQRRFIMVLCMRCEDETSHLDDETVAFRLRISLAETLDTKRMLISVGLIYGEWFLCTPLETQPERPFPHVWKVIRDRIFKRDDYTCKYCGKRGVKLECDHIVPVSRGGSSDDSNLATACFDCNRSKRDKLLSEWAVSHG